VLIFCPDKARSRPRRGLLKRNNHAVAVLHSNRTQKERRAGAGGLPLRPVLRCWWRRHRRARAGHCGRDHVITTTRNPGSITEDLHATHWAHGRAEAHGDAFTIMVGRGRGPRVCHRTVHQPENPRVKLENLITKYTALFEESKPGQPQGGFPGKVRGRRIRGGYHFAPGGRRG